MSQKNCLITGASRGIGKATKELFETNGYKVYAPTRDEMNLADGESVKNYCSSLQNVTFSTIINNAGINDLNEFGAMTCGKINNMIQIDLQSPIMILNSLVPNMKRAGYGRIVNIGSIWAVVSKPARGLYSAAKNGIHGVTNALALEVASYDILVNTVCPGFTLTELTRQNNTDVQIRKISESIPVHRMALPEEIAKLVYFLGSEENTYITGQKIIIDGGYTVQ